MQKLLLKRTIRDLRANALRYASLFILIVATIFLILSLVGSSESVIYTVDTRAEANHLEDGQFQVFFPLEEETLRELEEDGVAVEEAFFLDFTQEDGSTLRLFRNRERIDLVEINEGCPAKTESEIVPEYHYAEEHGLSVGDVLSIGGGAYTVTGVGSSPDYDCCIRNMSDVVADGNVFGTGFVTAAAYAELKEHGQAARSEEYRYSFLLNGAMTAGELKDRLLDLKVDRDKIQDVYFVEMLDELEEDKNKLTDGIGELADGADELKEGADELADGSDALLKGIYELRNGSGRLLDGTGELEDGAAGLADGAGELTHGMDQAKDGSAGLTEGTEQIAQS
jgi:putative ABC transport system permease protein